MSKSTTKTPSRNGTVVIGGLREDREPMTFRDDQYDVEFEIRGTNDLIFHRFNVDPDSGGGLSAKGVKVKDIVEDYLWRDENNLICIPGEYFKAALVKAAKYLKDPRSPRASAIDLFKAAITWSRDFNPIISATGNTVTDDWDYVLRKGVRIGSTGNRIPRERPAFMKGWTCVGRMTVLLPEYISIDTFHDALHKVGRLIGVGDHRPDYGRFQVARCHVVEPE